MRVNSELNKSVVKKQEIRKDENISMTTTCEGVLNEYDGWYMKYFFVYSKISLMLVLMKKFIYKARRQEDSQREDELTAT